MGHSSEPESGFKNPLNLYLVSEVRVVLHVDYHGPPNFKLFQFSAPSIPSFLSAFFMRLYWILSNAFSVTIEMIMCFFSPLAY